MADRLGLPALHAAVCTEERALADALPTADVLVAEAAEITRAHVAAAPRLRFIQKFGRDPGNIDLAAARERGIPVANLLRVSSLSAADNMLALVLALARKLVPAHQAVVARRDPKLPPKFPTDPPRNLYNWAGIRGLRILAEQTLGLIGLGENSGEIARRARAFGMRVLYYKRRRLPPETEAELGGVEYVALDRLLAESDFVSLHVPYGPATEKMIGPEALAKMKPGAFLINTARGGLVDEQALYEALRSGRLGGAGLDVYRYEPIPPDCPLLELDNVVWAPHTCGGEPAFLLREVETVMDNIARVLRGEPPVGLVSPGKER
jgi:phosphoglycerate dehydrogenase-like enzyme